MRKTPWFTSGELPVHIGVYETQHPISLQRTVYQHWDGETWGKYMPSPKAARDSRKDPSSYQNQPWRGLAEKPK